MNRGTVLVGCEVTGLLFDNVIHREPAPTCSCCPGCPARETVIRQAKPFWDDRRNQVGGLHVVRAEHQREFAGVLLTKHKTEGSRILTTHLIPFTQANVAAHRDVVRTVLDPLGLWDPAKFGIWAIDCTRDDKEF